MPGHITNIAGYRFVAIDDLARLQAVLRSVCADVGLKGTVLLAPEGINFFLAGRQAAVEGFTAYLDGDERFRGIPLKTSFTDYQPFNRLNVRQKKEIISVGLDHINPAAFTGPEMEPRAFKAMRDTGHGDGQAHAGIHQRGREATNGTRTMRSAPSSRVSVGLNSRVLSMHQ